MEYFSTEWANIQLQSEASSALSWEAAHAVTLDKGAIELVAEQLCS